MSHRIIEHGTSAEEWLAKFKGRKLVSVEMVDEGMILNFGDVGLYFLYPIKVWEVVRPNPTGKTQ